MPRQQQQPLHRRHVKLPDLTRQLQQQPQGSPLRLKLTAFIDGSPEDWGKWQAALEFSSSVTAVDARVTHMPEMMMEETVNPINFSPAAMYQILQDVGRLPNLQTLKVWGYCDAMPVEVLTNLFHTSPHLTTLHLISVKLSAINQLDLEQLSDAVASHPSLTDWRLQDCQFVLQQQEQQQHDSNAFFLDSVLAGISASETMQSLFLSPTRPNAMGKLSVKSIPALGKLKSLRLGLIGNFFEKEGNQSSSPFKEFLDLLASNQTELQYLHIPFQPDVNNCLALQSTLKQNTTVRGLSLKTYTDCPTDHLPLVAQALKVNRTLLEFELLGNSMTRIKDPRILQDFASVLEVNYTLQELILFELVTSRTHAETMNYYAKLNQQGRQQWLDDLYRNNEDADSCSSCSTTSKSVSSPLELLDSLAQQDPDHLYYYLSRMNPNFLDHVLSSG